MFDRHYFPVYSKYFSCVLMPASSNDPTQLANQIFTFITIYSFSRRLEIFPQKLTTFSKQTNKQIGRDRDDLLGILQRCVLKLVVSNWYCLNNATFHFVQNMLDHQFTPFNNWLMPLSLTFNESQLIEHFVYLYTPPPVEYYV